MLLKFLQLVTVVSFIFEVQAIEGEYSQTGSGCPAYVVPCQGKGNVNSQKVTILTFYIEQKADQEQDFIQMSLTVKQKDTSLKKAIDKANRKVQAIKALCQQYCKKNKGQNCGQTVQVDNFKVEPSYQVVRRQPIFNGFVVTNLAVLTLVETQQIGELIDGLLGVGIYEIKEPQWKPNTEVDSVQKAIDTGISQATELCRHINRKIGAILSITEIQEQKNKQKADDEAEGSSSEQKNESKPSVLKFEVECIGRSAEDLQTDKANIDAGKADKKKKKKK